MRITNNIFVNTYKSYSISITYQNLYQIKLDKVLFRGLEFGRIYTPDY